LKFLSVFSNSMAQLSEPPCYVSKHEKTKPTYLWVIPSQPASQSLCTSLNFICISFPLHYILGKLFYKIYIKKINWSFLEKKN